MSEHAAEAATSPSLLLRIRDPGDQDAWRTFVDVYGPLVYRHARRRGLQDADAAEVTQEVLFQVSRSIQTFEYRPEQGRFRDWLGTVTHNKICSLRRRQAGAAHAVGDTGKEDGVEVLAAPPKDTQWAEEFYRHLLQTALTRTRPHFEEPTWRAFELLWRDQLPVADVARELGQTVNWVYLAKSRVLHRLQQEVQHLAEDMPLFLS